MTNAIATTQDFQQRMFEKIRDQMGSLLTDEELKALVETAINKAFFEERVDNSGYNRVTKPSLFVELISAHVKDRINEQIGAYVVANASVFEKAVEDALAKGFFGLMQGWFDRKIQNELFNFGEKMKIVFNDPNLQNPGGWR